MVRIYELNYQGLCLYVGRTKLVLKERYWCHMSKGNEAHSKNIPDELCPYAIKLLEECSEEEQIAREQYWYDTLMPLYNKCRPGQSSSEGQKLYEQTEEGRQARARARAKYRSTEQYKETKRAYERLYRAKKKVLTDTASCAGQT